MGGGFTKRKLRTKRVRGGGDELECERDETAVLLCRNGEPSHRGRLGGSRLYRELDGDSGELLGRVDPVDEHAGGTSELHVHGKRGSLAIPRVAPGGQRRAGRGAGGWKHSGDAGSGEGVGGCAGALTDRSAGGPGAGQIGRGAPRE